MIAAILAKCGTPIWIDPEDIQVALSFKWTIQVSNSGVRYARGYSTHGGHVFMHRLVTCKKWKLVDHKDGDGLNNTRRNLRRASTRQNAHNASVHKDNLSGLKGVSRYSPKTRSAIENQFRARIRVGRRDISLGYFKTAEEAHAAYVIAAVKHFGEFARAA